MKVEERRAARLNLKRRGFDLSTSHTDGSVRPKCSGCRAVCVNGTPCHEHGCPNQKRK